MGLHYTWFVAAALIVIWLVVSFQGMYLLWQNIIAGMVAGLLFFASMCVRELAHSFVATNRGMPVKSITLYVFGGVPRVTEEDIRSIPELLVAVAGPLSSLMIAGVFYAVYYILAGVGSFMIAELMQWLFFFNIVMAIFNLVPGFPLDGGRGLRAILWMINGDFRRATRISSSTGRGMGFLLILLGVAAIIFAGQWFTGAALLAGGWFLAEAAAASRRQMLVHKALHGATARFMMTEDYTPIKQQLTVALVREYVINSGQNCFVAIEDGKLVGLITLNSIAKTPRNRWDSTRISEIMTPAAKLKTAHPKQPVVDLLEQMEEQDINQIPVLEDGKLIGMVKRESLVRFLTIRARLEA